MLFKYPSQSFLSDHLGNTRVVYQAKWDTPSNQLSFELQGAYDYFPYGKILRSFVGGNGQERYLTTQHERDEESISENNFGTGFTNAGARLLDHDIVRWNSIDPEAADYPSLSTYNYVAGNPLLFIDPDGKKIVPYDEKEAAAYAAYRERVFSSDSYKSIQNELLALENSKTIFTLRTGDNRTNTSGGGNIWYNDGTGEIDINFAQYGDFSEMQKLSHELKHADQYLNGKLGFNKNGSPLKSLYDYQDEFEAFSRQNLFAYPGGKTLSDSQIHNRLQSQYGGLDFTLTNKTLNNTFTTTYLDGKKTKLTIGEFYKSVNNRLEDNGKEKQFIINEDAVY